MRDCKIYFELPKQFTTFAKNLKGGQHYDDKDDEIRKEGKRGYGIQRYECSCL